MKRTQTGWIFLVLLPLIQVALTVAFWREYQVPVSEFPDQARYGWYTSLCIVLLLLLLFYRLTIVVTDREVRFYVGIGLIRGNYKLDNITEVKAVSYFPLGWGIRLRPGKIIYNVSGRKAVELSLNHRRNNVLIGTNHAEELAGYIRAKINPPEK
ncbi:MAG: hypothetical protein GVY19_00755 [Bacteroidetes bacterium]|jgi:hypothetical protein|nr:hypothetical protein [Bacteroidota bacterium]